MNKRLSFPLVLCIAALGVGCDDNGGGCPTGMICIDGSTDDGGGGGDAGPGTDAGPTDGGGPAACGTTGTIGGACRRGACGAGLDCADTVSVTWGGLVFPINAGAADPGHPGEFTDTGVRSDVPLSMFPGGQCTRGCDSRDTRAMTPDTCASDCATCSNSAGIAPIAGLAGGARGFARTMSGVSIVMRDAMRRFTQDGICRSNCVFDPSTNGGCPTGYTCDPGTNVCIEACVNDAQCAATAASAISPNTSLVIADSGDGATCNTTTGRCDYPPSAGAGLNTACDTNADCPASGVCLIGGYCGTLACVDVTGTMAGPIPCATGGECVAFGGNNGSVCIQGCMSPSDCNPGQACSPVSMAFPSGNTGICFGACESDSECRSSERCELVRESPALSVCSAICDPDPTMAPAVPDAITCEANEACVKDGTNDYGYCQTINQICTSDGQCNAGQACRIDDANQAGRCEAGCETTADCVSAGAGAECVIFDDMDSMTPPLTLGVCRAPGGSCATSPLLDGDPLQPMLGDAQCIASQHCSQTTATDPPTTGTCVDD